MSPLREPRAKWKYNKKRGENRGLSIHSINCCDYHPTTCYAQRGNDDDDEMEVVDR